MELTLEKLVSLISFLKIWRQCTRIFDYPGVVSQIAPLILYPIYFKRPLDIGLVGELRDPTQATFDINR